MDKQNDLKNPWGSKIVSSVRRVSLDSVVAAQKQIVRKGCRESLMLNRHWVLILSGIYSTNTTPPRFCFYFYGFLCARKNHSYCPSTWMIQRVNMKKGAAGAVWVGFRPIFFPASKASFPLRAYGVFSSKEFTLQGFPNSCGLKSLFTCSTLEISLIF